MRGGGVSSACGLGEAGGVATRQIGRDRERRSDHRVGLSWLIEVRGEYPFNSGPFLFKCRNASRAGLYFRSDVFFFPGQLLHVVLSIPADDTKDFEVHSVTLYYRIVRVERLRTEERTRFGVAAILAG